MEVSEGQILAGKYRIERVLGRGAMGLVVAATHLQLGERVALKFLLPEALENRDSVARFEREARAAVKIKSEHVARVSDVGTLENGAPYMVMEYLEGTDLSGWLRQRGPLPVALAVDFVLQACEAIAEAHALGIVHRDLKPANLFVVERSDGMLAVKVLDFGISKFTSLADSGAAMTKTTAVMGSPLYMSPEQMQSAKDVDPRGDIWALGVVLYELLSARLPFPGETMAELVLKVVAGAPVALSAVSPHVPPGLEAAVFKCLEKDRAARYQSVADFASALLEFAPPHSRVSVERIGRVLQRAGLPASLAPSSSVVSQSANPQSANAAVHTQVSWGQSSAPAPRRRRAVLIAAALLLFAVSTGGVVAFMRSSRHGVTAATSAASPMVVSLASLSAEPIATPSSSPTSSSSAVSAPSAVVEVTPQATSKPSAVPAPSAAPELPKKVTVIHQPAPPPAAPAPSPVVTKPDLPAPATNPLKMPLQ
jgi:eukaryotic-like serine/threonine-protein kinase